MKRETTFSGRGLVALVLGFFATMVIDWLFLESITFPGITKLYALGGLYLTIVVIAYVIISALESLAIGQGLPVSTSINAIYEIATAGIFWTIGVFIGVGFINHFFPRSNYLVEGAVIVGLIGVVLGEYTLWRGRIGRNQSTRP